MNGHPLRVFVGLAFLWTWVSALPLVLQKRGLVELGLPDAWEAVGAFGPALAAWVVVRRTEGPAGLAAFRDRLLRWRIGTGAWALTLLTPPAFLLLAALLVTLRTGESPSWQDLAAGPLGSGSAVAHLLVVAGVLQGLGEEPGWRGYLLPKLLGRWRVLPATLLLFPVWWLWHLPFFLARPDFGLPQFLGFGLGILSAAVWLSFLWERTRSSLVVVAWHAALNLTRGVALGFSTGMFLVYGAVVSAGAACIVIWWLLRRR